MHPGKKEHDTIEKNLRKRALGKRFDSRNIKLAVKALGDKAEGISQEHVAAESVIEDRRQ